MKIQELSIADYKVLSTEFEQGKWMNISTAGSYDIELKKAYGVTRLHLTKWVAFSINIFESREPFGDTKVLSLDVKNLETFEYIQEVEMINAQLFLRGFSKESGRWLVYEFTNPQINVYFESKELM